MFKPIVSACEGLSLECLRGGPGLGLTGMSPRISLATPGRGPRGAQGECWIADGSVPGSRAKLQDCSRRELGPSDDLVSPGGARPGNFRPAMRGPPPGSVGPATQGGLGRWGPSWTPPGRAGLWRRDLPAVQGDWPHAFLRPNSGVGPPPCGIVRSNELLCSTSGGGSGDHGGWLRL